MSKRQELRQKRQHQARRQQLIIIGAVAAAAVLLIGFSVARSVYENSQPIGPIVEIEKEAWPSANGKSLGSAEAKVVVQEFSDFQ